MPSSTRSPVATPRPSRHSTRRSFECTWRPWHVSRRTVHRDGPKAVRRHHRRPRILRSGPVPARRSRRSCAGGAVLRADTADAVQPGHCAARNGPATARRHDRAAAQSRPESVLPRGGASAVASGGQCDAEVDGADSTAGVPPRRRRARGPLARADGADLRVSAQRPGIERPIRRTGAPVVSRIRASRLVARAGRRPARRPRHPGHRRQRGSNPTDRTDDRGARRRRRDRRRHHGRTARHGRHGRSARQHPCCRIHSA
ncbi:MAG: hypothetical protein JWR13_4828 [Mycobacterium sp.]|nr:hypothetical protein [Mycobacterium sp.]